VTALVLCAVFPLQYLLSVVGGAPVFALSLPLGVAPWTLVTSVYAHAGIWHLVSNVVVLVPVGLLVERGTTPVRYHAYFLASGAIGGVTQVLVTGPDGSAAVIGASGAVFALVGYLVTGNRLSNRVLGRVAGGAVSERVLTLALVVVAVVLAVAVSGPGTALVAHATGLAIGLLSGWRRVLAAGR
jgi:membrane associated rhomboid family serine protease